VFYAKIIKFIKKSKSYFKQVYNSNSSPDKRMSLTSLYKKKLLHFSNIPDNLQKKKYSFCHYFCLLSPQKYRQNGYVVSSIRFYHNVAPLGLKAALACYRYHNAAPNEAFYLSPDK